MKRASLLLVAMLLLHCANIQSQILADTFLQGPTIGAVNSNTTYVTIMVNKGTSSGKFQVKLLNTDNNTYVASSSQDMVCEGKDCVVKVGFQNLKPGAHYKAQVYKNSTLVSQSSSAVRVPTTGNQNFSFLIGSCAKLYDDQHGESIYNTMANQSNIDFMLWLGDNIYLPSKLNQSTIFTIYLQYRTKSTARTNFLKKYFHFGIWDDHDYGYNNAASDFPLKEHSSKLFKAFWPSSGYANQSSSYGTQSTYSYEDVDFFLTDVRWNKNRYDHLGKTQLDELKANLLKSKAPFKIIVLGTSVIFNMPKGANSSETDIAQTKEKKELFDFIYNNKIKGVIFFSGDKHFSYFAKYDPRCNSTYPIYEYMCSGLTSDSSDYRFDEVDMLTQFSDKSFGKVDISGPTGNRNCTITALSATGKKIYSLTLNENQLKPSNTTEPNPNTLKKHEYNFTGNTKDAVGNLDAKLVGPVLTSDRWGASNNAYKFSKYPDQVTFPPNILNSQINFTTSFWIKPDAYSCGLLSAASSTFGNEFLVYLNSLNKLNIYIKNVAFTTIKTVNLNKWNHIVITRNGVTGEVIAYINGAIAGKKVLDKGKMNVVAALIGNDHDNPGGGGLDPNQQFKGVFDDFVIYKEVLCAKQVEEIYNQNILLPEALVNSVMCEPGTTTLKVKGATNGKYRWYKNPEGGTALSNTLSTYTTNITESTTYWVAVNNSWKYTERIPVTQIVADPIYNDSKGLTYPSSLFAWYKFDGNTKDETSNLGNAIVKGPVLTTGRKGVAKTAYQFSKNLDLIYIPNTALDGAEKFSLSFWIKTTANDCGVISAASSEAGNELLIYINTEGALAVAINELGRTYYYNKVNDNKWHHIAFTADCAHGQGNLYLDGVKLIPTTDYFGTGTLDVPPNALVIGNDNDTAGGGGFNLNQQFVGTFDDLKIYRRILSNTEVQDIRLDKDYYNQPFVFTPNSNEVCSGNEFTLQMKPYQKDVKYSLVNSSGQVVSSGTEKEGSIRFNAKVTEDQIFSVVASNSWGCKKSFNTTFDVKAIIVPKPVIVKKNNTLCTQTTAEKYQWYLNNQPISTQACANIIGSGNYQVQVQKGNCISELSSVYSIGNLGVDDIENSSAIMIYPTLAKDVINIKRESNESEAFQIFDSTGKLLSEGILKENLESINVSFLNSGVYLIIINTESGRVRKSFIKQ